MSFGGLGGGDGDPKINPVRPETGSKGSIWHERPTAEEQIAQWREGQGRRTRWRTWLRRIWPLRRKPVPHG